jgi:hypothetical protein
MPLGAPSDLGGGRGLYLYGGCEIVTRRGDRVRVQDSSSIEGPHLRVFRDPGPRESADCLHVTLTEVIELRDRLDQFLGCVNSRWGDGVLEAALEAVAQHRRDGHRADIGE